MIQLQGLKFEVVPSTFEEDLDKSSFSHPYDYAMETAKQKTLEVAMRLLSEQVGGSFWPLQSQLNYYNIVNYLLRILCIFRICCVSMAE